MQGIIQTLFHSILNVIIFDKKLWVIYISFCIDSYSSGFKLHMSDSKTNTSSQNLSNMFAAVVVQLLSLIQFSVTPQTAAHQAPQPFTISQILFKFMSVESVMLSDSLILCSPLHLLPSIFPSIMFFLFLAFACSCIPNY